jgi:Fe-S oxidoreductase
MEPIEIVDERWEELLALTGGAAALCYQCGTCTATCPWGQVRQEPLSVRSFIRQAQLGLHQSNADLWMCTTCAQCEADCPRGVKITGVMRALRAIAWQERQVPRGLPSVLWSEYWNNNPWSQPPSQRGLWARDLDLPLFNPQLHEVLFYAGCTASYDRRAQKIARALVAVLRAAGVSFGYLGEHEPCCGEAVLSLGHQPYFGEIMGRAAQVLQEKGVTSLVTVSPHCYDAFKNHLPGEKQDLQVRHYTQFLAELVEEGRLQFTRPFPARVTFQDPCYLGRHNQEYQAPRCVLEAIPGLERVEMAHSGEDGLCCGGGGGRMWLETARGERFADLRVEDAFQTGAGILATACPFCLVCLEDSLKSRGIKELRALDIAEIAALALEDRPG